MHGLIFVELKKFVVARLGEAAWRELLSRAGLQGREYLPVQEHPDAEAIALMAETGVRTGLEKILIPQLDHRVKPCNFVMLLPRIRNEPTGRA